MSRKRASKHPSVVSLQPKKKVSDPVHGIIELTELESLVVDSKAFQRLHNVRQLGLAHYVFPAANYSRFSHSVGACHNAQKLLTAIQKNSPKVIGLSNKEIQRFRLAALIHDLGHYPFSHAFEHEIEEYYAQSYLAPDEFNIDDGSIFNHEEMGLEVLRNDEELKEILRKFDYTVEDIRTAFQKPATLLAGILSSDLDCDRLDYLRRTAHHSGLPYGNVDINYIIDQATTDINGRFCFGHKAIRAADHLLVSRYFDYLQVPYHKSVVALEWSLKVVIRELLARKKIECSANDMTLQVINQEWHHFDDGKILALARELRDHLTHRLEKAQRDYGVLAHIAAILHRKPAKLIASVEMVSPVDMGLNIDIAEIKNTIRNFRNKHGICSLALHLWQPKDFSLIKASTKGSGHAISSLTDEEPEFFEYVQIANSSQKAQPIFQFSNALMSQIYNFRYRACRIYSLSYGNKHFDQLVEVELLPLLRELGMETSS